MATSRAATVSAVAVPFALVTVDGARRARRWVRGFAVVTLVTGLIGLALVQRTFTTIESSLDVAAESVDVARGAVGPAAELALQVATLSEVVAEATSTNLADGLEGFADTADRLADITESIERFIPGNTTPSAADELRSIADGLAPLPGQLRATGESLTASTDELTAIVASIQELPAVIDDVATEIDQTRDGLTVDIWLWRVAIVALTVLLLSAARAVDHLLGSVDQPPPAR